MLDSEAKKFLERIERYKPKPLADMTPDEARQYVAGQSKLSHKKSSSALHVSDVVLTHHPKEIFDSEIRTPLRFYRPEGLKENPPLILYFHGGGFVTGDLNYSDQLCQILAEQLKMLVVSVEYRLAPEHSFPVPVHEGESILKTLLQHPNEYRFNTQKVILMGDSAGANIAAVVTNLMRASIWKQILLYPSLDFSKEYESMRLFAEGYFLTKANLDWGHRHYIQNPHDKKNPIASPILDKKLAGLPETLIVTAEYDPLRDEGRVYAEHLIEQGNEVTYFEFPGVIHCFATMIDFFPTASKKLMTKILQFVL